MPCVTIYHWWRWIIYERGKNSRGSSINGCLRSWHITTVAICTPFYLGQATQRYDFTVTGRLSCIKEFRNQLKSISPKSGYYQKASNLTHGVLTLLNPPTTGLYPPLRLVPPHPYTHTATQSINPQGDASYKVTIARLLTKCIDTTFTIIIL